MFSNASKNNDQESDRYRKQGLEEVMKEILQFTKTFPRNSVTIKTKEKNNNIALVSSRSAVQNKKDILFYPQFFDWYNNTTHPDAMLDRYDMECCMVLADKIWLDDHQPSSVDLGGVAWEVLSGMGFLLMDLVSECFKGLYDSKKKSKNRDLYEFWMSEARAAAKDIYNRLDEETIPEGQKVEEFATERGFFKNLGKMYGVEEAIAKKALYHMVGAFHQELFDWEYVPRAAKGENDEDLPMPTKALEELIRFRSFHPDDQGLAGLIQGCDVGEDIMTKHRRTRNNFPPEIKKLNRKKKMSHVFRYKSPAKEWEGVMITSKCHYCEKEMSHLMDICEEHLQSEWNLKIQESQVQGQGKGLFAWYPKDKKKVLFSWGNPICYYNGLFVSKEDLTNLYGNNTGPYAVKGHQRLGENRHLTGYEDGALYRGVGSYINHRTEEDQINAIFALGDMALWVKERAKYMYRDLKEYEKCIVVNALRDIRHGEEIFANYGNEYVLNERGVSFKTLQMEV